MMLPNEDVLFVQYKVPTIVMSRPCDQLLQVKLTSIDRQGVASCEWHMCIHANITMLYQRQK